MTMSSSAGWMEAMLHSHPMNMRITVHSLWNQNSKIPPEQFYGGPSPASASGSLTLHRMALDILSIPAMAAEVERLFSQCKRIIKDDRHSLEPDSIEALECVKSFYRRWLDHSQRGCSGQ
jgi:hypothetical protein